MATLPLCAIWCSPLRVPVAGGALCHTAQCILVFTQNAFTIHGEFYEPFGVVFCRKAYFPRCRVQPEYHACIVTIINSANHGWFSRTERMRGLKLSVPDLHTVCHWQPSTLHVLSGHFYPVNRLLLYITSFVYRCLRCNSGY